MGIYEHWPYVNFHDMNLDWIIKKIKNVETSEANSQASAEASAESAAASQLSADASLESAGASQRSAEASQQSAADSQESAEASAASELSAKNYADHIADPVSGLVTNWLTDHITNPTNPPIDTSLTIAGAAADARITGNEINELKEAFNYEYETIVLSVPEDGYIDINGAVAGTGGNAHHVSFEITDEYVEKNFLITGSLWWSLFPYVFIGNDSSIIYPSDLQGDSTIRTIADLPFTPTKTGTLYVNYHNDNPVHSASVEVLVNLKENKLPDLADVLKSVSYYEKVNYTKIVNKYLNGSTGAITNATGDMNVITDYIPVAEGETYLITTEHFWSQGMYVWYDENREYISGVSAASGGTLTKLINQKVVAPHNAAFLVVAEVEQTGYPEITIRKGMLTAIDPHQRWSGKKWVCVGDSLTENNGPSYYHYFDYVAADTGIETVNMGMSGTGYARQAPNNNAFYQRILNCPADADVVTIFGSFNDLGAELPLGTVDDNTNTTLAGCMNLTLDNLFSINPIMNVGIVAPTPWGNEQPSSSGGAYNYVEMLKQICERRSIPFLDLWRHSGLRPWDADFTAVAYPTGDIIHPNEIGHKIIAPKFKAFLESLLL